MTTEHTSPFQATTDECLKHLFSTTSDNEVREKLAEFAGVKMTAMHAWENEKTRPQGEIMVKVRYFLELLGYRVTELKELEPIIYELGGLFAYSLASIDDIADQLGYTTRPKTVLDLLMGRQGLSGLRLEKAKAYVASTGKELSVVRRRALAAFSDYGKATDRTAETCAQNQGDLKKPCLRAPHITCSGSFP